MEGPSMTTVDEVAKWLSALETLVEGLASRFFRDAGRRRALTYLRGLLAPVERKNGWQLAEAAGDPSPAAMQDFLTRTVGMPMAWATICGPYVVKNPGQQCSLRWGVAARRHWRR